MKRKLKNTIIFDFKFSLAYFGVAALILSLLVGSLLIKFLWFPSPELEFFSLSDTNATYTIEKDTSKIYSIKYSGSQKVIADHAFVISSPVELSEFEGKNVSITGAFVSGNKQCIKNICKDLSARWVGIKIDNISLR